MIEFLVKLDDESDPVLIGRADCSRAVPNMLAELADKWRDELLLLGIAAAIGGNYEDVITVG